jgi:uncharacterized small protein (DUF1192 family)
MIDPTILTAITALLVGVLGAPALLRLIDTWTGRHRAAVDADLTLAGGWREMADRLTARVSALEAEIERLRTEVTRLQGENATLHSGNSILTLRVETLTTRLADLERHDA